MIKKSKQRDNLYWYIAAIILCLVLYSVLEYVFIENLFVTFQSPEEAFRYSNKDEVKFVVEGEDTALVVAQTDVSTFRQEIYPRSGTGWKLASTFNTKEVYKKSSGEISAFVYQYDDSNDYYVLLWWRGEEMPQITDNNNSTFCYLDVSGNAREYGYTCYIYCAYVKNLNNQYLLNVNGKEISLLEE